MLLTFSTAFFILINLVVSPFYLLMAAAPRASLTRRLMATLWPVALPALVHVAFILVILIVARPNVLQLWHSLYVKHGVFGATTVAMLSQLYGQHPEYAALHGWVHVVSLALEEPHLAVRKRVRQRGRRVAHPRHIRAAGEHRRRDLH